MDDVKISPLHWFRKKKRQGRVSPDERAAMQEAWLAGDTVTAIAERMRRTPRTVRRALELGNESPPSEGEVPDEEARPQPLTPSEWRERIMTSAEPHLGAAIDALFEDRPEFAEAVVRKVAKMPPRSLATVLEEGAIEHLESSPELRQQAARAFLRKYEGQNKSESEIVADVFEQAFRLFLAISADAREGAGARVLDHAIASGEATKMVAEVASAFSGRSASQPGDTQNAEEASAAAGVIQPVTAEAGGASSKGTPAQPEADQPAHQAPAGAPSNRPLLQPTPPAQSNGTGSGVESGQEVP